MARKQPVKTVHIMTVAKSLEAQNEAVAFYVGKVRMLFPFKDQIPEELHPLLSEIEAETDRVRALLWPEEE